MLGDSYMIPWRNNFMLHETIGKVQLITDCLNYQSRWRTGILCWVNTFNLESSKVSFPPLFLHTKRKTNRWLNMVYEKILQKEMFFTFLSWWISILKKISLFCESRGFLFYFYMVAWSKTNSPIHQLQVLPQLSLDPHLLEVSCVPQVQHQHQLIGAWVFLEPSKLVWKEK